MADFVDKAVPAAFSTTLSKKISDFGTRVKKSFNPDQPEKESLSDYRSNQLFKLQANTYAEKFNKIMRAAYVDQDDVYYENGRKFFEPLWEQILSEYFANTEDFHESFTKFKEFCYSNGWNPEVHGPDRVLVLLAMYTKLIRNPPEPEKIEGIVAKLVKGIQMVLKTLGIQPDEIQQLVKKAIALIL